MASKTQKGKHTGNRRQDTATQARIRENKDQAEAGARRVRADTEEPYDREGVS